MSTCLSAVWGNACSYVSCLEVYPSRNRHPISTATLLGGIRAQITDWRSVSFHLHC